MEAAILTLLLALLCAVVILIGEVMALRAQLRKRPASGSFMTITVEADTTDATAKINALQVQVAKLQSALSGLTTRSRAYG